MNIEKSIIESKIDIYKKNTHEYIDYKYKICIKPWGYEFLCYESKKIGMWFLSIKKDMFTSLHCHLKKDTTIICCDGILEVELIDKTIVLYPSNSINIEKEKFHALKAIADNTKVLEIEIYFDNIDFSDKNDLIRFKDELKRYDNVYSNSITVEDKNIDTYEYFLINSESKHIMKNVSFELSNSSHDNNNEIYILMEDKLRVNDTYLSPGSVIRGNYNGLFLKIHFDILDTKTILSSQHLDYVLKLHSNKKIILTSGCFDIVHKGHIKILQEAKELGDILIVCVSSDKQIKYLKGESRPVNNLNDRLAVLRSIQYIDYIIAYDEINYSQEKTLDDYMIKINPFFWVKGTDYTENEIRKLHPHLKDIKLINLESNISTTKIIQKIMSIAT
jgi:rfaE bifunctional protein nucleotidyltransferase chain/domain